MPTTAHELTPAVACKTGIAADEEVCTRFLRSTDCSYPATELALDRIILTKRAEPILQPLFLQENTTIKLREKFLVDFPVDDWAGLRVEGGRAVVSVEAANRCNHPLQTNAHFYTGGNGRDVCRRFNFRGATIHPKASGSREKVASDVEQQIARPGDGLGRVQNSHFNVRVIDDEPVVLQNIEHGFQHRFGILQRVAAGLDGAQLCRRQRRSIWGVEGGNATACRDGGEQQRHLPRVGKFHGRALEAGGVVGDGFDFVIGRELDDHRQGALGDAGCGGGFGIGASEVSGNRAVINRREVITARIIQFVARQCRGDVAIVLGKGSFRGDFVVNPRLALFVVAGDDVRRAECGSDVGGGYAGFDAFLDNTERQSAVIGGAELLRVLRGRHASGENSAEGEH